MIFSEGLQNQKEFYMQGRKLTMCDSLMTKARTLAPISMEACCCQRLQLFDVHSFWFAKLWNAQGFFQPLVFFSLNHLLFSVMRYLLPWCGGPDNTQRSSFDQMWSSNLRPDEAFDDRLPEAWYFKVKMLVNFRMPVFTDGETMTECGSFFDFRTWWWPRLQRSVPHQELAENQSKFVECWVQRQKEKTQFEQFFSFLVEASSKVSSNTSMYSLSLFVRRTIKSGTACSSQGTAESSLGNNGQEQATSREERWFHHGLHRCPRLFVEKLKLQGSLCWVFLEN